MAIHGNHLARAWPHPKDKMFADQWVAASATVELVTPIFLKGIERMQVRGGGIPKSINYFDNPVRDAIAKANEAAKPTANLSPEESRWLARVAGWRKNPRLWREELWGEPPGHPMCRVPHRIMAIGSPGVVA